MGVGCVGLEWECELWNQVDAVSIFFTYSDVTLGQTATSVAL